MVDRSIVASKVAMIRDAVERVRAAASNGLVDLEAPCNEIAQQTLGGGS